VVACLFIEPLLSRLQSLNDHMQEDHLVRFRKLIEAEVGPLKPLFGEFTVITG
jgi:hypothetical protein